MTAQDREAITHALFDGLPGTRVAVDRIEALIEQARADAVRDTRARMETAWAERVRESGAREVRTAKTCHRLRRLIAALLRSRRIDRAVIREAYEGAHWQEFGRTANTPYQQGRRSAGALIRIGMQHAERTAREENHR